MCRASDEAKDKGLGDVRITAAATVDNFSAVFVKTNEGAVKQLVTRLVFLVQRGPSQ